MILTGDSADLNFLDQPHPKELILVYLISSVVEINEPIGVNSVVSSLGMRSLISFLSRFYLWRSSW